MKLLHHKQLSQAGLIFDHSPHYLDHLGPFCALMKWPLIICESDIADLARNYYPDLEIVEQNLWELTLPKNIVSCSPFELFQQTFPTVGLDNTQFFWLPHGNSDKGWKGAFFHGLLQKEVALVYGQQMLDFFAAQNVKPLYIRIGDFRHCYFLRHRSFYESLSQMQWKKEEKTILYAPTWEDAENNSSFWTMFPRLAEIFDPSIALVIKLHPNTLFRYPAEVERLKGRYAHKQNFFFLEDFPPIHALLSLVDVYLGDMSSIGYDFLRYNRPMFFFNPNQRDATTDRGLFLARCGHIISPDQFPHILQSSDEPFLSIRAQVHQYTFDSVDSWDLIAAQIQQALL